MLKMLVIADDLSGAADCGVACASHHLRTMVLLDGKMPSSQDAGVELGAEVLAVDANTRHLEAAAAARITAEILQRYRLTARPLVFKKLDSTLRGNLAAELAACLASYRDNAGKRAAAVMAPAFPASGRTTVGGRQLVHGNPLEQTELWQRECAKPCSDIAELLRPAGLRTALLELECVRSGNLHEAMLRATQADVLICDAETDEDLRRIAEASAQLVQETIWAGSAGLAYHLPRAMGLRQDEASAPQALFSSSLAPDGPLSSGATLFVVGSLSSTSRAQVAAMAGAPHQKIFCIPPQVLLAGEAQKPWNDCRQQIESALAEGCDVVAMPDAEYRCESAQGPLLTASLARLVAPCAQTAGALVATGGESARAVFECWNIHALRVIGELETGVPFSVTEGWQRHLPVMTKAGAFGNAQTLAHCRDFLRTLDRSTAANLCGLKGL